MGRALLISTPIRVIVVAALLLVGIAALGGPARAAECADGVIETVAGKDCCFAGDGGPATEASLHSPDGLALDREGNLFIADTRNGRIRRVSRDGIITTIAGIWRWGRDGDGGPAGQAALYTVSGLAFGPDGSLYIADYNNPRIRRIDPVNGRVGPHCIIATIAGNGEYGPSGDGGPAVEASFHAACTVAVGPDGAVYVGAFKDPRIRKIDPVNGRVGPDSIITSIAGTGESGYSGDGGPATAAQLSDVWGMVIAPDGSLYFSDRENGRVRKIDPDGVITTIAGGGEGERLGDGGPATEASLDSPHGLALAPDGSLYIADSGHDRVRKVSPDGIISTVAGGGEPGHLGDGGPATEAALEAPVDLALAADGTLYIADARANRVRRVDPAGIITTVAGNGAQQYSGDGGPATEATLRQPQGLAFGPDGALYIADAANLRVRKLDAPGGPSGAAIITTVAGRGEDGDGAPATEADIGYVTDLAVGADGSVYITSARHRVFKVGLDGIITTIAGDGWYDPDTHGGRFAGDGGPATKASLSSPAGVAVAADGTVYIADEYNNRVRRVDPGGIITTLAGDGEARYAGDGGPASAASLNQPNDVALAPDGTVYVADSANYRARRVAPDGVITTVAGTGEPGDTGDGGPATEARLAWPQGLAPGPDGSLYICDQRIRKVAPDGIITTVAGSGQAGFWGDGGPATEASFHWADDVLVAPDGSLYIADLLNHRIRRVRWRPCDPAAAKAAADELRAAAGDSRWAWREVAELQMIAQDWDQALAAAGHLLALIPETDERERARADVLAARVYAAKRDDHEARRRLIRVMAQADDPVVMGEAAAALVDLYLVRDERDQAVATLTDLRLRAQDAQLRYWIDGRLKQIGGE